MDKIHDPSCRNTARKTHVLLDILLAMLERCLAKLGCYLRRGIIYELSILSEHVARGSRGPGLLLVRVPISCLLRLGGYWRGR